MQKSFNKFAFAGAAMALAMSPVIAGVQDQTMPDASKQEMPSSMPRDADVTPPPAPPTDTVAETYPDAASEGTTQGSVPDSVATKTMTPEQQQAAIATWPAATQSYYQSLTEERQAMFWALSDADKVSLSTMPEEQREVAWSQIEAQIRSQG